MTTVADAKPTISTGPHHKTYSGILDWLSTVDHKKIGLMYFWFTFVMGIVGGALAGAIRIHLATPAAVWEAYHGAELSRQAVFGLFGGDGALFAESHQWFNVMTTMHASVMIFFVIIPAFAAFGNYLVPLMIGARDMAFPKMNAFAFWLLIPAAVMAFGSFFVEGGPASSGWTAYPPLSLQNSGIGQDMWVMTVHLAGLSSILGALNIIATTLRMRTTGMTLFRMPIFVWAAFASIAGFASVLSNSVSRQSDFKTLIMVLGQRTSSHRKNGGALRSSCER